MSADVAGHPGGDAVAPCLDVDLDLPDRREGKVRISYALGEDRRLFITTDRLSAFDRVIAAGGYVSINTGSAPEANSIPVRKEDADMAFDSATCIACGAASRRGRRRGCDWSRARFSGCRR